MNYQAEKNRIFHIAFEPRTGVFSMICNLAQQMSIKGRSVELLIYYSDEEYKSQYSVILKDKNLNCSFCKVGQSLISRYTIWLFKNAFHKKFVFRNSDYCFFHDAHYSVFQFFHFLDVQNRAIIFHGCPSGLLRNRIIDKPINYSINLLLFFFKPIIVAVSNADVELIRKHIFLPKSWWNVIHNGIRDDRSNLLSERLQKTRVKGFFNIGWIGSIEERKRWRSLVDLIDKLNDYELKNFHLTIAGTGPEIDELQRVFAKKKNVSICGNIRNPSKSFYPNIDLLLMTSSHEGLPMVIIEAFQCGVPVIATNVGGIPEIVNGKNGLLINDPFLDIFNSILEVLETFEKYENYSLQARQTFLEGFQIESVTAKYLNLFD
jgi:glycosyltransferase involved in cell wall biosynthesis